MKLCAAHVVTAVVCALAGTAWAEGDEARKKLEAACLKDAPRACIEIGKTTANEEPAVGDVAELGAKCEKTHDEQACGGMLRERIKEGCRKGNQANCRLLGQSEAERIAEETAPPSEDLEASCKRKDQHACADLAIRLLTDEPTKQDQKRALVLLDRSCKGGIGDACAKLGLIVMMKGGKGDGKKSTALFKRACDLGSQAGCKALPPPPAKIVKPGEIPRGQGMLGALGATDDVGQTMKNLAKLSKLLKQNCDLGYADACAELQEPDDPDPAKRKISTSAEIAAKIRKLERQAAAGPAPKN